jgi:hypothetical protein
MKCIVITATVFSPWPSMSGSSMPVSCTDLAMPPSDWSPAIAVSTSSAIAFERVEVAAHRLHRAAHHDLERAVEHALAAAQDLGGLDLLGADVDQQVGARVDGERRGAADVHARAGGGQAGERGARQPVEDLLAQVVAARQLVFCSCSTVKPPNGRRARRDDGVVHRAAHAFDHGLHGERVARSAADGHVGVMAQKRGSLEAKPVSRPAGSSWYGAAKRPFTDDACAVPWVKVASSPSNGWAMTRRR